MIIRLPALSARTRLAACCLSLALAQLGCAGGSAPATGTSQAQLDFGVQMARRGLWNEALFRFEQAQRTAPADARLLNNLAVAYEAVGRYDEALAAYQRAVRLAPGDSSIRRNLSRFSQFYESFRPREGEGGADEQAPEATPAEAAQAPAETPEAPAGTPEQPAETPGSPAGAPEQPAGAPESPAETPEAPETPAESPEEVM